MDPLHTYQNLQTRRQFFGDAGVRLGGVALGWLMAQAGGRSRLLAAEATQRVHPGIPSLPHFAPKAKSIIYLHMNGAPSRSISGTTNPSSRPTTTRIFQTPSA